MEPMAVVVAAVGERVDYLGFGDKKMSLKKTVIQMADGQQRRMTMYDEKKFASLTVGRKMKLKTYKVDEETTGFVIYKGHETFRMGTEELSNESLEQAENFLLEPHFRRETSAVVATSPLKRKLSFRGVVDSGDMQSVGKVRKLLLRDDTGSVTVNLWNTAVDIALEVGDAVDVKDVSVSYDKLMKKNVLSVNRPDQLVVLTQDEVTATFELQGIEEEEDCIKILVEKPDEEATFTLSKEKMFNAFFCGDIEEILSQLPVNVKITTLRKEVINIEMA